jgi:hypothetical protein
MVSLGAMSRDKLPMAQYFFDFYDGKMHRDAVAHECEGPDDIRLEAMHALPAMARDQVP